MYACMYVCMDGCIDVRMHACTYVYMDIRYLNMDIFTLNTHDFQYIYYLCTRTAQGQVH